jgi:hypothetical protein
MLKVGLAAQTGEVGPGGTRVAPALTKPPPTLAEVAALFPQLEILECLGSGGMGAVYKARQPRLDRLVALKILTCDREDAPREARFAERFEREARALAKLSHPNIVAMYEFGQVEGLPYFIMEYVDGLNVRQLEQSRQLTPREALQIIPQICEALQFAHDEGIVHRDIKPANILVDRKGRVKIADFGIAKIMGGTPSIASAADKWAPKPGEGLTQEQILGTPHYMAPEQAEHPQTVDHRADIYSLGVVFYEMLTGELPVGKFQPPSRKVQIDVRLDEIVLHTLEEEPERRYQHASELKTDVENIRSTATPARQAGIDRTSRIPGTNLILVESRNGLKLVHWTHVSLAWVLLMFAGAVCLGLVAAAAHLAGFRIGPDTFQTAGVVMAAVAAFALTVFVRQALQRPTNATELPSCEDPRPATPQRGAKSVAWSDVWGSLWALAALVLLVGRKVARTEPLMYSFFGLGGWFYPSSYHLLVAVCFGFALACLVIPRLRRRTGGRETTGHGQTVSRTASDDQALAAVRSQLKTPAIGVFAAGCLNLAMIAGVLLKFVLAATAESPDRTMTHFATLPLLAMLFVTVVIIAGARLMGRVANHGLAITASVLAILVPPGAVVGLPFGIWSLIVLYRPDVRAAFEDVARKAASEPSATPAHTSSASVPRPGVTWSTVAGVAAAAIVLLGCLLVIVVPSLPRALSVASAFGPEIEVSLDPLGNQAGDRFLDLDTDRIVRPPDPYSGWSRERKHEWLRQQGIDLMLMGSAFQSWSLLTPVDNATTLTKVSAHAWQRRFDPEDSTRPPEPAEAIQFVSQGVELLQVRLDGRPTHPDHTFAFRTANGARGVVKVSGLNLGPGEEVVGLKLRFKKFQAAADSAREALPPAVMPRPEALKGS